MIIPFLGEIFNQGGRIMSMKYLQDGFIEVTVKGLDSKFYVKDELAAIEIAMKLGGYKC